MLHSLISLLLVFGDPNQAYFWSSIGIAFALVLANFGSAYGTAKSGVGIIAVAVLKSDLIFKSIIPVVMAGVLGMYGMIIAILMKQQCKSTSDLLIVTPTLEDEITYDKLATPTEWSKFNCATAYKQLGAGLCCGLSNLAAGLCIGIVGDAGVRGNAQKDILIALILMMIFAEALALYGFIVAIVLSQGS